MSDKAVGIILLIVLALAIGLPLAKAWDTEAQRCASIGGELYIEQMFAPKVCLVNGQQYPLP